MTRLIFKKGHIGGRQNQVQLIEIAQSFEDFKSLIEEREPENWFPQEDGSIKDQAGRTVWEHGAESFDFGDYSYEWSTIEDLSASELKAIAATPVIIHTLEADEKRQIITEMLISSNEIVHYFGNFATIDTITSILWPMAHIDQNQECQISETLCESNRDWDTADCDPDGPTEAQEIELCRIVKDCARSIAAIAIPEEYIYIAWYCGDASGYIDTDGIPGKDGKNTSMDIEQRMRFESIEDAQAFIDAMDMSDAHPDFKMLIEQWV